MSVGPFVVEFVVVFFATLLTIHYYGNLKKMHFLVTLAVFISWFFSFLIIFILPMDVTNTCYLDCLKNIADQQSLPLNGTDSNKTVEPVQLCMKPWSFMPPYVLPDLWRVIYWSSQILSWILLPIMQSYVYAGDFTVWGKLKTALFENAIWYGSYLIIFGGLLIYVALKPGLDVDVESLKLIGITASNTWGLLLLVLLLGYGLVDLPRTAWNMSMPNLRLESTLFRVAKLSTEKEDAEEELSQLLTEVKSASEEIKYNSDLREYLDIVIAKCPGSTSLFSKGTDDYVDYNSSENKMIFSMKPLVKLHKRLIVMSHRAMRTQFQWNATLRLTFYLEDVLKAESSKDNIFKSSFSDHCPKSRLSMKLRWYWEIVLRPWLLRLLAIVLFFLSISLVWSEVTFFSTKINLSIFAVLIDITKEDYLFFSIEVVSCITIAYMCACTYYTVFKMKLFNYYYFAPNHQTDSNSLLFSGLLLCRLTYALCLNFLAMIHMDGHITGGSDHKKISETDFTRFMGHMDLLSFISKGFNVYYPMTVLLVCFCTYFSLGKRLLHCFGVQQFFTDDDFSADLIREGKEIAKREKRKLEREINGKDWSERSKNLRNKYGKFNRKNEVERIDDSGDDEMIDATSNDPTPKTKLGVEGRKKYTIRTDDKADLVSNIEYAPSDLPRRGRGYENGGSINPSVPRNIFDDT